AIGEPAARGVGLGFLSGDDDRRSRAGDASVRGDRPRSLRSRQAAVDGAARRGGLRMNERDRGKKPRALFNEAHRAERPPAFGQTWEAARRMRSARIPRWALIPALAAAALLIVLAVRKQSGPPDAPKEFQTAEWSGEVDARLGFATPGIGVLDG